MASEDSNSELPTNITAIFEGENHAICAECDSDTFGLVLQPQGDEKTGFIGIAAVRCANCEAVFGWDENSEPLLIKRGRE